MPQPTAPMLHQADYHNYNEHSSFNDYYGGFEPKTSNGGWNTSNGPRRVDGSINKENKGCCTPCGIHFLSALVVIRSVILLLALAFIWNSGYKEEWVAWLGLFEAINLAACLLMTCGIECSNPYLCVIFTVIRTVEAFIALVLVIAFGYAVYDSKSDAGRFIRATVNDFGKQYQNDLNFGTNWDDLAYQLSVFLCFMTLMSFAIAVFFMRCSWTATLWAADNRRRRRVNENHEVSRVMVASDELYTNY